MTVERVQLIWQGLNSQAYHLTLDATTSETHEISAVVTDHPVEKGVNISDHVRPEPDVIKLEGVVSNTPIFLPPDYSEGAELVTDQLGNVVGTIVSPTGIRETATVTAASFPLPPRGPFNPGGIAQQTFLRPALDPKTRITSTEIQGPDLNAALVQSFTVEFDRVKAVWQALRQLRDDGTLLTVQTDLWRYENMVLQHVSTSRTVEYGNSLQLSMELKQIVIGRTVKVDVPAIPTARKAKGTAATTPATAEETSGTGSSRSILSKFFGK
jgi:hypothetical protein